MTRCWDGIGLVDEQAVILRHTPTDRTTTLADVTLARGETKKLRFGASPATHRRLPTGLRGGILQTPWPNHALEPTPWIAVAFPSRLVRHG